MSRLEVKNHSLFLTKMAERHTHLILIFSALGLSRTNLVSNCVFMRQIFFPTINSTLSGRVIDHALNWKKYDHLGYKR